MRGEPGVGLLSIHRSIVVVERVHLRQSGGIRHTAKRSQRNRNVIPRIRLGELAAGVAAGCIALAGIIQADITVHNFGRYEIRVVAGIHHIKFQIHFVQRNIRCNAVVENFGSRHAGNGMVPVGIHMGDLIRRRRTEGRQFTAHATVRVAAHIHHIHIAIADGSAVFAIISTHGCVVSFGVVVDIQLHLLDIRVAIAAQRNSHFHPRIVGTAILRQPCRNQMTGAEFAVIRRKNVCSTVAQALLHPCSIGKAIVLMNVDLHHNGIVAAGFGQADRRGRSECPTEEITAIAGRFYGILLNDADHLAKFRGRGRIFRRHAAIRQGEQGYGQHQRTQHG